MATKGRTGNKEAIAASNAKKKTSYLKALQSYNDSTASYKNEIKTFNILTKRKGKSKSGRFTDAEDKQNKKEYLKNYGENLDRGIYKKPVDFQIESNYKGGKNADRHSYKVPSTYTKESIDKALKPTKPKPPVYEKYVPRKIDKINVISKIELKALPVKPINPLKLTKVPGYLANKGKYPKKKKNIIQNFITTINPFSGNKVVRKKRNVKNLVTGKNNRIQ